MIGLRNGTPITLTSSAPTEPTGAPTTETTIINPPTGKMGHGNVLISLALAKQQLGERPSTVLVMASVKAITVLSQREESM